MAPERPRDDRDSPCGRSRDDRYRERSRSRDRDRDWGRDRSPRRRTPTGAGMDDRRRRSASRTPPRDDRVPRDDRDRRPSSRGERRSRSRSPLRGRRSPSPSNGLRYRRDYSSSYGYRDPPVHGYDTGRGRGWYRGSYPPRGGYQPRQYDSAHIRTDSNNTPQRTPPAGLQSQNVTTPTAASDQHPDSLVPSGPASWRRAQQYKQDRPYQHDYRPNLGRGGASMNSLPRHSPRPPFPSTQSPAPSPHDAPSASPTLHRAVPVGPRALQRPPDGPVKKQYVSPVADLDDQLSKLKADHEKLEAKDGEVQKRKRAALAEWTLLDRESKREGAKVEMTEKLLEAAVNGTVFVT